MGVYQSATAPAVRRKGYDHAVPSETLDMLGKPRYIRELRKTAGIPRKVEPTESTDDNGVVTMRFSWYEVETFN